MKKFRLSLSLAGALLTAAMVAGLPQTGFSAGDGAALDHFTPVRTDRSLQRGAKIFVNYCQGCHTAEYQRYSRLAEDIGISCLLYTSPSPRD